jgi:anti-anti-sigma regulatory factor
MPTERLVLVGALGFEARRDFINAARAAMEVSDQDVELDCSTVDVGETLDDPVIGMLVTLARAAQRRGARVAFVQAPRPMRVQFEAAGIAHFFNWKP